MNYKKQEIIEKINKLKSRDKLNYYALQEINRQIEHTEDIPLNMIIETIKHINYERSIKLQELDNVLKSIIEEYKKQIEEQKKSEEKAKQDKEQEAKQKEETENKEKDAEVKSKIKQELDDDSQEDGFDFNDDDF